MKYIIIKNGKINFRNLIINNISLIKLFNELKLRNVNYIDDIKRLIIFKNIYILTFLKEPLSLIIDGKFIYSNLLNKDKNIFWIKRILKKYNLDIKVIKYAVYFKNKLFIIRYNN